MQKENPLLSIAINIILPVAILNQVSKLGEYGPLAALILALSLPLGYGAWDYLQRRHKNMISLLGAVNILFTGGLALMELGGFWFAVKEAGFPLLIGVAVAASAFTRKPFVQMIAYNDKVMNLDRIRQGLESKQSHQDFQLHLKISTLLFALSFFISSFLNFVLARRIFLDIDPELSSSQRTALLNEQIADMTWLSFIVIALPLMVFTGLILWHLIHGIKKHTGLSLEEILPEQGKKTTP